MTAKQFVEMGLIYADIEKAELAKRLGWSPQVLSNRMKTGKFTLDEWQKIGEALGAKFEVHFSFPDGKSI